MKAITTMLAAAAAVMLWTLPVAAERPDSEEREARRAEARAAMIEALELSDDQKTQVETIFDAKDQKRKEIFDANREQREEVRSQMASLREETKDQLRAVLTEEQFSRLEELREEHRKNRPHGRRGHRGAKR
jgi:Spy/CpxP family protein refolding chaperone